MTLKGKVLREAERLARGELVKITTAESVGELLEVVSLEAKHFLAGAEGAETPSGECGGDETRHYQLRFRCLKAAYPDWHWVVTATRLTAKSKVTISEVTLLPTAESVLAPEWVPWSERLAEFRRAQAAAEVAEARAAALAAAELAADDEAAEELLNNDFSDFDDEINGVDIDSIDIDSLADVLFPQLLPIIDDPADSEFADCEPAGKQSADTSAD